ncbi:MAG: type II toxin-antitoxin system HicA family toxin [Chloroflexi bacterium]|nr:type II toxin-antitoxin system HicA family toxin [Chloroflexota bacterium]
MNLCDDIKEAKSGKEVIKIIEQDSRFIGWRDSGSSHRIAKFENGVTVPIPVHGNRDIPIGTKLKIIRILRAGGLCTLVIGIGVLIAARLIGG